MASTIVARNYAETLFELARRHGGDAVIDEYASAIDEVATLLDEEPLVRQFLETPKVDPEAKQRAIQASFAGRVPDLFLRFLVVVVQKRRQGALREIARQYHRLVDEARGRARAEVATAKELDDALRAEIEASLERRLGRTVVAEYRVDPALLGGVVIRVGGQILDGSLRRRVAGLKRQMLRAKLPAAPAAGA